MPGKPGIFHYPAFRPRLFLWGLLLYCQRVAACAVANLYYPALRNDLSSASGAYRNPAGLQLSDCRGLRPDTALSVPALCRGFLSSGTGW